jgi:Protein of unknown function (DUF3108)
MHAHPLPAAAPQRPWPALAGLVAGVLVAHVLLLAGLPAGVGPGDEGGNRVLSARQIALPVPPPVPTQPTAVAPPAATPVPSPKPTRPAAAAVPAAVPDVPVQPDTPSVVERVEPPAEVASAPVTAAVEATTEPVPATAAAPATAPAAEPAAAPAAGGGDAPPVYPTRLPPAAQMSYELRRGLLTGQGELLWRPGADGYELQIEGIAFGLPLLGWVSRGGFDAAGLAPQRFVDRRRGRDVRAASFQRDKGLITWSSVIGEAALAAGAQDRLSWMVQLAGIVAADPARQVPGARVVVQVAGARGDVDLWTFTVMLREAVDVVGTRVPDTLLLRREPRKPFDTLVEVWLDPARNHLPARLKLSTAGGGDSLEFLLKP